VVVHAYNPSTWEVDTEDLELEASLDYIVKPFSKKKKKRKKKDKEVWLKW
jgi:hypothetical protein